MKKVLIVSYEFPPLNYISSKRYGIMCKYFEKFGYKPYVLTTHFDTNFGIDVRMDLEVPIDEKDVIRIGKESTNSSIKNKFSKMILQVMRSLKIEARAIDRTSIGWCEKVKSEIERYNLDDIDIIVGTYPRMANLFLAKYLSKKLRCPYIAEIRDLISDYTESAEQEYERSFLIDQALEKCVLKHAQGIVSVTPGFRDILRDRYPGKLHKVVFNGWEGTEETEYKAEEKYLYYAGSWYEHRLESFGLLMRCMKKVNMAFERKVKLIIRSIGPERWNIKAKKMIQKEKMQDYVCILDAASEDVVKKEQSGAYINVVLSTVHTDDKALMTTIPGKVYELLNVNAPILAIVPKGSDVEKVLIYTNKGIASTSEDEITDYILSGNTEYKGNKNIKYFSRKKQAERLCRFMDEVLKTKNEKDNGGIWDKA